MRKFTILWQLMIVLLLTSSVAMAQKTATIDGSLSATLEKPMTSVDYDQTQYPTPKQGGDVIAEATVITAIPFTETGTTAGYTDDYDEECPYTGSTSPDVVYSYTPAADESIALSLCNDGTDYDTKLYIYDTPTPVMGDAIACNDDACSSPQFATYVSAIDQVALTGGVTYYIVVDGYGGENGNYTLTGDFVTGCVWGVDIDCPAGSIAETEPCGEDLNGGCNMEGTQLWEPVPSTGGTICGTTWADGASRDTDWLELVVTETAPVVLTANSDQLIIYGAIADGTGAIINPDCSTVASIAPNNTAGPCDETTLDLGVLEPGTYWFFVGMTVYEGFPCDVHYYITFDIGAPGCPDPTDLTASNLTTTTADLEWTSNSGLSNLEYGLQGFTVGVDPIISVTGVTSPYAATGLMENTYDFYVQDDCGEGDLSNWVGPYSFTIGGMPPQDCENFDALTVGGFVADQLGGLWTTWSGTPGTAEDAIVSDMYSVSPENSFLVEGTCDLVWLFDNNNLTSGSYTFTHEIYIPTGKAGYWNLQKDVVIGTEWGFQVQYEDDDMMMHVDAGAEDAAVVPYLYDTWYHNEIMVDLDNDWCEFYVDGVLIIGYQWTLGTFGTAGALTLGSTNIYASAGAGGADPGAHFDDFCFFSNEVSLDPPTALMYDVTEDDVNLSWTAPGSGSGSAEWIQWHDGTNIGSVGLGNGGTFYAASHWMPAELAAYDGMELTKISFFPYGDPLATFKLMIWTGPDAGTLVMEQDVTTFTIDEFNEIDLVAPVTIDASMEFWFGYEVTHGAGTNPAGRDAGPALAFSGDMLSFDGATWVSMATNYGFNYNWNLAAYVMDSGSSSEPVQLVKNYPTPTNSPSLVDKTSDIVNVFAPGTKALIGYNVYRDDMLIASPVATTYTDMDLAPGTYDYCITAVYDEGESDCSNTVSAFIPNAEVDPPLNVTAANLVDSDIFVDWDAPGGSTEDFFEGFESGTLPTGWMVVDNDGDNFNWINTTEYGGSFDHYEGVASMTSASWDATAGPLTPDNYLITPAIEIGAGSMLSYWHDAQDPGYPDDFYYVKLSTTGTDLADFTETLWSGTTPTDWAEVTIDLSAYAGNMCYIAFHHTECTDWFMMKIDAVSVSATPTKAKFTPPVVSTTKSEVLPFRSSGMSQDEIDEALANYTSLKSSMDLIGYNVYRNGTFLANTVDTDYTDMDLEDGDYIYCVTAVYDEGESMQVCAPSVHIGEAQSTFSDDFENGDGNWVYSGTGSTWGLTDEYALSGSYSLTDSPGGNYLPSLETYATMAVGVDLSDPAILSSNVTWWMIMDIESGDFDYLYVEASDDDFATFIELGSFFGEGMFDPWVEYSFSLGSFVGSDNVKVRFHFSSDGGYEVDGCYIDDFSITISDSDEAAPEIFFDEPFAYEANVGSYIVNAVITDVTGVASTQLLYTLEGDVQPNIAGENTGGDNYTFTIPLDISHAGSQIDFQIEAVDSSPAANEALTETASFISGEYIKYDNAFVDFYQEIGPDGTGGALGTAVRFTIEETSSIATALIRNYADQSVGLSDEMDVHVWAAGADGPGDDLITPITMFPEADLVNTNAFTRIDLRDYNALFNLPAGTDIYIGFTCEVGVVRTTITQPGSGLRSYASADAIAWTPVTDDYHYRIILGEPHTGIIDNEFNNNTQVYPNPASDMVNISSDVEINSVKVFNFAGQLIVHDNANSSKLFQINTSDFESGIYFFQVETNEGLISKRIIIQ